MRAKFFSSQRIFACALALSFTIGASSVLAQKANKTVEKEVADVLTELASASQKKDLNALMKLHADSPDTIYIGASEKYTKLIGSKAIRDAYEKAFKGKSSIKSISYKLIGVSSTGDLAWVAADGINSYYVGDKVKTVKGRLTAVMKRIDGQWRFVQFHWSYPVPTIKKKRFEAKEKKDSTPETIEEK